MALQHGRLDQKIVMTRGDLSVTSAGGLQNGEPLLMGNLLYALLLPSDNAAAVAIARGVAGDEDTFVGWMNEQAAVLNATIRDAAQQAGVEFVDPTPLFAGHGLGSDEPWFNDLDVGGPGLSLIDPGSFHPNGAGQAAIAAAVQAQLESPREP